MIVYHVLKHWSGYVTVKYTNSNVYCEKRYGSTEDYNAAINSGEIQLSDDCTHGYDDGVGWKKRY